MDLADPPDLQSTEFANLVEDLLRQGKEVRFAAPGSSMWPVIRENERITIEPVGRAPLETGDIVLYRRGKRVMAHRILRIEPAADCAAADAVGALRLILRPDAQGAGEEAVTASQVLGRVISVERGGKSVEPGSRTGRAGLLIAKLLRRSFRRDI